jgi:Ulp1 family protease
MLNDNVVQGYSNLLAQQFCELGLRVQIVAPQFYPTFHAHGWEWVQHWVQQTELMKDDWTTSPLILIPIFTGPCKSGHSSGLIVNHTRGATNAGIQVYQDSLSMMTASSTSNMLKTQLTGTPLLNNGGVSWVTADTPVQATGSNDCAAHMCVNFALYLKAVLDGCISLGHNTVLTGNVTATSTLEQISSHKWGQLARRHMLESFRNGRIDCSMVTLCVMRENLSMSNMELNDNNTLLAFITLTLSIL